MSVANEVELGYPETSISHGPTDRQALAHRLGAHVDETLYGGATGGGKTDWLIGELLRTLFEWPGVSAIVIRRKLTELTQAEGIQPRLMVRIPPSLGSYNGNTRAWQFRAPRPGLGGGGAHTSQGSKLYLGHVARDAEVADYLGAEHALQAWDQLEAHTQWQYLTLRSRLRVSADLERRGLRPRSIATANPGGRGHAWVKRRWIDPAPPEVIWQPNPTEEEPAPGTRLFVPALLDDNPHVGASYDQRLANLDPQLRRAWRWGDWDVLGGQRFGQFERRLHVIKPEQLPIPLGGIRKVIGIDYGVTAPFCALWLAQFPGNPPLVVVYRELYKADLTPTQQAQLILRSEREGERDPARPLPAYLDPSTWSRDPEGQKADPRHPGRPPAGSIAARYVAAGLPVRKAQNDRLLGAALVDDALGLHDYGEGLIAPGVVIYDTCPNLIRTLPELLRDEQNPEDVERDGAEDHAYDGFRYGLAGLGRRPPPRVGSEPPGDPSYRAAPTATASLAKAGF